MMPEAYPYCECGHRKLYHSHYTGDCGECDCDKFTRIDMDVNE